MSQSKRTIVVIGPGPQFKGGLANYTVSLAKAFAENPANQVHLISWSQQYPAIIPRDFKDKVSKSTPLADFGIQEEYLINYNNPFTWGQTVRRIVGLRPAFVVVQWSIALQGLPLGYIANRLRKAGIEVFFDLHFVIQKEASALDGLLSRYALSKTNSYVVHSQKTAEELAQLLPGRRYVVSNRNAPVPSVDVKVVRLYHPIYDLFEVKEDFDKAAFKQKMGLHGTVFLFFGFIRKYKGLHYCIEAFARLKKTRPDASLLIVGESFWKTLDETKLSTRIKTALFGAAKAIFRRNAEDESNYNPLALIEELGLQDSVKVVNTFVPNHEVYQYFQASDALLLFYEHATPSGVESMAYNFKTPILATAVGHFPETILEAESGYLAKADDVEDMARTMAKFMDYPVDPDHVTITAKNWTWSNYARAIEGHSKDN